MKAQFLLSALAAIATADAYVGSANAAAKKYPAVCLHQYSACITTSEASAADICAQTLSSCCHHQASIAVSISTTPNELPLSQTQQKLTFHDSANGDVDDFCSTHENGNYRNTENCRTFITCSNGYFYLFDCPANLVYNERTDQCDYLENVPECQESAFHDSADGDFDAFCSTHANGNYLNTEDCTRFITCSNGYSYDQKCPANLVYNERTDQCDYLANVPECQ